MALDSSDGLMRPFTHLHVASGYSLRYGAAFPEAIVQRAAEHGMTTLALTDRDGLYGAVRFVTACADAAIAPIVGCDLAIADVQPIRVNPAFGGAAVDERLPRCVVLAQGAGGMTALNRLISAHHEIGLTRDVVTRAVEIAQSVGGGLAILLGPDSDLGRAVLSRKTAQAQHLLQQWRMTGADIVIEVVSHRTREPHITAAAVSGLKHHGATLSSVGAAKLWKFADDNQVPAVLSNAVRYLEPSQARVVDVLDAARRLVPLAGHNVDRANNEGFLKSSDEMWQIAIEIAHHIGYSEVDCERLFASTEKVADKAIIDPQLDMGVGSIHVPELDVILGERPPASDTSWSRPAAPRRTERVIKREAALADGVLRSRCEDSLLKFGATTSLMRERLEDELAVISQLGFASFFLTVAEVVTLTKSMDIRVAARGSGAGSYVNHLLGISVLNPLDHNLIMERFLSPLRSSLPDIDIDVESHRRLDVYDAIFERFGGDRVACVSMMETYRVRHAIRDVGAALGLPAGEVDAFAKAFPHIRAKDARLALKELPELRRSGFGALARTGQLDEILQLVEGLDGLPRHVALHPCGVLLSDSSLLDRTPVQASAAGFPMSHYDKDDVETLGFLKLDVLGIRMQSAMSHALSEIERTENVVVELDSVPFDDKPTFDLIASTRTLGCFQIESPGQRELVGKFAPETFNDIIIDISLFRPGPVKSDMITPFLNARQGWRAPEYLHPDLEPILRETCGVVVFHEQVIKIVATLSGCSYAEADEVRRSLGDWDRQPKIRAWFYPEALRRGYDLDIIDKVWDVLRAFASFGFCKAHAGAFAVPTYQSAWLKAHHPAAFYAGILTHDPGMYPRRLILDDARQFGVPILGLDINHSKAEYVAEATDDGLGVRISLSQVKGISEDEVESLVAAQPFTDINDVWNRAEISRPTLERLVLAGGFDSLYCIQSAQHRRRGSTTRRDLFVHVAELDRWRSRGSARDEFLFDAAPNVQLMQTGLPEMDAEERLQAELEILGMDVSHHVMTFYEALMKYLGVVRSENLLKCRSRQEVLVAGVKVATQTPPVRSGKRVIFLTLDDATGPVDAAFFETAQGPYANTVFHSWLLLVRGVVRRTGPRGISINATGCWDLQEVHKIFDAASRTPYGLDVRAGLQAVYELIDAEYEVEDLEEDGDEEIGRERSRRRRAGGMGRGQRVLVHPSGYRQSPWADIVPAGGIEPPSKLWHTSPGTPG